MDNWEEKRLLFIENLKKQEECFNELFTKDKDSIIISSEERGKLNDLKRRNKSILEKLESREFTVAVVGLEKAGKSTLGNALINSEILPEYTERCTYTTTELRAGEQNEAEITFYSEEEFARIFQKMLSDVGYNYNLQADFRTLTPDTFRSYWEAVSDDPDKRNLYERHNGKTDEDIITILKGSNEIAGFLGQPVKKVMLDSEQGKSELQRYITGITDYKSDGSAVRSALPYAVKNVIIRSKELGSMENIVLYDVPGFDSTTELHRQQTESMLIKADAIILVTNVGDRPNINSPQLDMLRKVRDQDGIKLRDKTFIFGNKIDMAGNDARARDNISALRNEADRYQIASGSRVISGSAKAYLEKLGLYSPDELRRGKIDAKKRLEEWGMSDGIDELHGKIKEYYENDRFEVLKRRADNTTAETIKILRELLAKYSPDVLNNLETGGKYLLRLKGKAAEFDKEANDIGIKYREQISAARPFSEALKKEIETIFPLTENLQDIMNDVRRSGVIDTDGVAQLTSLNTELRKKISLIFMEKLVGHAAEIVSNKQQEIRSELVKKFLSVMGMEEGSDYEAKLTQSTNELFDDLLIKNGEDCRFNILIERFSSGLIETLILMPFAEHERLEKVRQTFPELFSLAMYYSMPDSESSEILDVQDIMQKFFAMILAHEYDAKAKDKDNNREQQQGSQNSDMLSVQSILREFFETNLNDALKGAASSIILSNLPLQEWALMFVDADVKFEAMPKELSDKLDKKIYNVGWQKHSNEERAAEITKMIQEYLDAVRKTHNTGKAHSLSDFLENLNIKALPCKAKTESEMLKILDDDINILRELTVKAVIRAIGLERAFISIIVKNINFIRSGIMSSDGESKFDAWIEQNVRKIMNSEFAAIDRYNMDSQTRRSIVASIQQVLSKIE
ncbi:MAG: dynamin family protein [Synergistaceae bacterium]|nr:dynamin family protein [Synergistaceae bacterium]